MVIRCKRDDHVNSVVVIAYSFGKVRRHGLGGNDVAPDPGFKYHQRRIVLEILTYTAHAPGDFREHCRNAAPPGLRNRLREQTVPDPRKERKYHRKGKNKILSHQNEAGENEFQHKRCGNVDSRETKGCHSLSTCLCRTMGLCKYHRLVESHERRNRVLHIRCMF